MAESTLAKMPLAARIGITVGLLVLGALAYYVVFYSEVSGQIESTVAQRSKLEGDLRAAKKAEAAYQKDYEELARRRERKREFSKILPTEAQAPAFLLAVQSVANSSGVELTAWSPQPEVKKEYYASIPMRIKVSGRFHQIAKFLYGIGQSDRIMNVENISLKNPEVVDQDVYVQAEGLATAFRALSDEELKPKPAARRKRR